MQYSLDDESREILTPSSLNRKAKQLLESGIGSIVIEGEISSLAQPGSGHRYFTLNDKQSGVRCAWFRQRQLGSRIALEHGLQVRVHALVSLYEPRGDYQLIVSRVEPIGAGDLQRELQLRIERLKAQGLFDSDRKKRLPLYPRHLCIVSSRSAAAVQDVLTVIKRRWPLLKITLCHASVQGEQAPNELIRALLDAETMAPDLILLTRGGGSLEDLWAFNDEKLAQAIADCQIPVVSAVGHQTDRSISDMVSDMAAPTPSAAAELITPDMSELKSTFERYIRQLGHIFSTTQQIRSQQLDLLASQLQSQHPRRRIETTVDRLTLFKSRMESVIKARQIQSQNKLERLRDQLRSMSPARKVAQTQSRLTDLSLMLERSQQHHLQTSRQRLQTQIKTLEAISPMRVLQRGYSVTRSENGNALLSSSDVQAGESITTTLHDGEIQSTVTALKSSDA